MSQYFQIFQLPEQFALDADVLAQRYRTLAAQCHPDKFADRSAFEQKQAVMMAAAVNEAYRVLSRPLERAAYLLQQRGIDADAPEHTHFAPEFLMQQMEWRERLAESRAAHDDAALRGLAEEIAAAQQTLFGSLKAAFDTGDDAAAAEWVRQGRFLDKLTHEIQAALP